MGDQETDLALVTEDYNKTQDDPKDLYYLDHGYFPCEGYPITPCGSTDLVAIPVGSTVKVILRNQETNTATVQYRLVGSGDVITGTMPLDELGYSNFQMDVRRKYSPLSYARAKELYAIFKNPSVAVSSGKNLRVGDSIREFRQLVSQALEVCYTMNLIDAMSKGSDLRGKEGRRLVREFWAQERSILDRHCEDIFQKYRDALENTERVEDVNGKASES